MNHMYINSAKMDASIGAEFGVEIRIGYLRSQNLFVINPEVEHLPDARLIQCFGELGGLETVTVRPDKIEVSYISSTFERTSKIFYDKEACLVQMMVENMHW